MSTEYDGEVELDDVGPHVTLISTGTSKKEVELIKWHLEESCTGVITLEHVFKRDIIDRDEVAHYEGLLSIALDECRMIRHDFAIHATKYHTYGAIEYECKKLRELIEFLEFWGPKTYKRLSDYSIQHENVLCFHIESVLRERMFQISRVSGMQNDYEITEDYHLDNFVRILKTLQAHWKELNFEKKCRLRTKCKELLDRLLETPPVMETSCCESCCIL